jgi:hypothetical protein
MPGLGDEHAVPQGVFERAMREHVEMIEVRVRGLYVRSRALFAEAVVATLVDGTMVEFPNAAWDVEMSLPHRGSRANERPSLRRRSGHRTGGSSKHPRPRKILDLVFSRRVQLRRLRLRSPRRARHRVGLAFPRPAEQGGAAGGNREHGLRPEAARAAAHRSLRIDGTERRIAEAARSGRAAQA